MVRTQVKGGARINTREGDGRGLSPNREEEDRNRWWLRSSNSWMLLAPLFFELDALTNRTTLRKNKYKTRQKKSRHEQKKKKKREKAYRFSQSRMISLLPLHPSMTASSPVGRTHRGDGGVHGGGLDVCHVPPKGDGFARGDSEE